VVRGRRQGGGGERAVDIIVVVKVRANRRLWGRLARAPEAVAGRAVGRPLPIGLPRCPPRAGPPERDQGA
jgi:hypothetical protein